MVLTIQELEQQYTENKVNKTDLFQGLSAYLSNRRGREFDDAAKEVVALCDRLDLGVTAFRRISKMARDLEK